MESTGPRRSSLTTIILLSLTILVVSTLVISLSQGESESEPSPPIAGVGDRAVAPRAAGSPMRMARNSPSVGGADSAQEPISAPVVNPQAPGPVAPNAAGCVTCPEGAQRGFKSLRSLCRSQPFSIAADVCMPGEYWRLLSIRLEEYQSALKPITDAMDPILEEITDGRVRSGQVEYQAQPDSLTAKDEQKRARKAWTEANRPNPPGQRVVSGGEGGKLFVIRIDPGDDARYGHLCRQYDELTLEFLHRLAVEIHPCLTFEKK